MFQNHRYQDAVPSCQNGLVIDTMNHFTFPEVPDHSRFIDSQICILSLNIYLIDCQICIFNMIILILICLYENHRYQAAVHGSQKGALIETMNNFPF